MIGNAIFIKNWDEIEEAKEKGYNVPTREYVKEEFLFNIEDVTFAYPFTNENGEREIRIDINGQRWDLEFNGQLWIALKQKFSNGN